MPSEGRNRRCWLRKVCRLFYFRRKTILETQNGEKKEETAAMKKLAEQDKLSPSSSKHSYELTVECRLIATIMHLPTELHLMIFELMLLPSQVSFALSCKYFYQMFGSTLDYDQLILTRLYSGKRFEMTFKQVDSLRSRVLIQLEDSRWAYCSVCLKLHPHDEFSCWQIKQPPGDRRCIYYKGTFHLCPCFL